jgi:D-alanine-D-alanine ligase-like ATP-grasp enzyme
MHFTAGQAKTARYKEYCSASGIPYVGSTCAASANISFNKIVAAKCLKNAGVQNSSWHGIYSTRWHDRRDGNESICAFPPPYVVKPPMEGSSFGILIAESLIALPDAIGDVLDALRNCTCRRIYYREEASVGVLENFRNEELYTFPPAQIIFQKVHDYLSRKVLADSNIEVPSNFTHEEKQSHC